MLAGIILALLLMTLLFSFSIRVVELMVKCSKVTVALLGSLIISAQVTLVDKGFFLNFLAWFALWIGICYLLCLLPRVNCAILFVCNTIVMALLAMALFMGILPSFIDDFELTRTWTLVVTGMVLVFAMLTMLAQVGFAKVKELSWPVLRIPDRIIASVIYAITSIFVYGAMDSYAAIFHQTVPLILLLVALFAAAYLADRFIFSRILLAAPAVAKWVQRREAECKQYNSFNVVGALFSDLMGCAGISVGSSFGSGSSDSWDSAEHYAADRAQEEINDHYNQQIQSANDYYDRNY